MIELVLGCDRPYIIDLLYNLYSDYAAPVTTSRDKKVSTLEVIATEMIFVFWCPISLPKQHIQNREDRNGGK